MNLALGSALATIGLTIPAVAAVSIVRADSLPPATAMQQCPAASP